MNRSAMTTGPVREHGNGCDGLGRDGGGGVAVRAEVVDSTGLLGSTGLAWVHEQVLKAARVVVKSGEVRVMIVDDRRMIELHSRHSNDPTTTDVLTFDCSEGSGRLDVDVFVSLDEAARAGAAREHGPERELVLYCVHAMLHCLGFDDHDEAGAAAMHRREDEILRMIGVGEVFGKVEGPRAEGCPSDPAKSQETVS